jgi:hypothetical protein
MTTWSCGIGTPPTRRPCPTPAGRRVTANRTRPTRPGPTVPRPRLPPDRDYADRYDADAEFQRGVPKPPGYLPDGTGRLSPRSGTDRSIELHHDERTPTEVPRRDIDRGDTPRGYVDRPAIRDPFDKLAR